MKKSIYLTLVLVFITGCSKESEEVATLSLKGTTWYEIETSEGMPVYEMVYNFITEDTVKISDNIYRNQQDFNGNIIYSKTSLVSQYYFRNDTLSIKSVATYTCKFQGDSLVLKGTRGKIILTKNKVIQVK